MTKGKGATKEGLKGKSEGEQKRGGDRGILKIKQRLAFKTNKGNKSKRERD